ncbi:hypothetical protein [Paenibacillus sp. HB172176]|uniref:hypothetical protein n=1 Tax=Paenibacillus sp. HB172176 TaxID=2493690 RepID=UPI001439615E|nr:hypothetical protein [Paenibacillus sp. HB172176]
MSEVNKRELIAYISGETEVEGKQVELVLKHEEDFINNAKGNAKGEVDIDSDELVDYIMGRSNVKLNEIQVEDILESEMDYLMKKGLAGYLD